MATKELLRERSKGGWSIYLMVPQPEVMKEFSGDARLVEARRTVYGDNRDAPGTIDSVTVKHFVVSGVNPMGLGSVQDVDHPWEVLVFHAEESGEVLGWGEVAGGKGISHEGAYRELQAALDEGEICFAHSTRTYDGSCYECQREPTT